MRVLKKSKFAATEQDLKDLREHMNLCGEEPVEMYLQAGVEHVEKLTCQTMREMQIQFETQGGEVCFPVHPVDKIDSVKVVSGHGVPMNYGTHKRPLCLPYLECDCGHYEVTYTSKPCDIPYTHKLAVFEVARALFDGEEMPDLTKGILKGCVPSQLDRFKANFGGSLVTRVK